MNKIQSIFVFTICLILNLSCSRSEKEKEAVVEKNTNIGQIENEFIAKCADACMVNIKLSEVGIKKAASDNVRVFLEQLKIDQSQLLTLLQALATSKAVTLPDSITPGKAHHITKISNENQDLKLDKKILTLVGAELRSEQRAFQEASTSTDTDVKQFLNANLILVKVSMDSVRSIRRREFPATSTRASKKPVRK